jgi:hypothetical protein
MQDADKPAGTGVPILASTLEACSERRSGAQ